MWEKLKAFCLHSLTVAWSYCLAAGGAALQAIDTVSDALGDPSLKDQIAAAIGDPRVTGRIMLVISVVTLLARLRSLKKAA
jgi:hypothetical protein